MTDDSSPDRADVASLAAHYLARARERAAREGAPSELVADVAELADLNARTEALRAEIAADAKRGPDADGMTIVGRYERGARLLDLSAASSEVLARVAGDPEAAELWLVIAGAHREHAAETRKAAALIADAGA
ncbi:MAG TPA: hypothetical protein VGJ50_15575 [Streptosporangiaceae bacterium]